MKNHKLLFLIVMLVIAASSRSFAQENANCICGKWIAADHSLIVDVYREGNGFKARLVWFNAGSEQKMEQWCDTNNPDPKLRARKIIGMNILNNLQYQPASNSYENGEVYDAMHGHNWNASATIDKGQLNVRGYWHFKFMGKSMMFNRVEEEASTNKKAPQQMPQRTSSI